MTMKELILALAEHVHVFGDDQVLIDQPGDRGFRVTGVSHGGILEVVEVIEDENGNLREGRWPEADALNARAYLLQLDPEPRRKLLTQLLADLADVAETV
jgi:hypothetical protein